MASVARNNHYQPLPVEEDAYLKYSSHIRRNSLGYWISIIVSGGIVIFNVLVQFFGAWGAIAGIVSLIATGVVLGLGVTVAPWIIPVVALTIGLPFAIVGAVLGFYQKTFILTKMGHVCQRIASFWDKLKGKIFYLDKVEGDINKSNKLLYDAEKTYKKSLEKHILNDLEKSIETETEYDWCKKEFEILSNLLSKISEQITELKKIADHENRKNNIDLLIEANKKISEKINILLNIRGGLTLDRDDNNIKVLHVFREIKRYFSHTEEALNNLLKSKQQIPDSVKIKLQAIIEYLQKQEQCKSPYYKILSAMMKLDKSDELLHEKGSDYDKDLFNRYTFDSYSYQRYNRAKTTLTGLKSWVSELDKLYRKSTGFHEIGKKEECVDKNTRVPVEQQSNLMPTGVGLTNLPADTQQKSSRDSSVPVSIMS